MIPTTSSGEEGLRALQFSSDGIDRWLYERKERWDGRDDDKLDGTDVEPSSRMHANQ
jgi:hypothetical protein